MDIRHRQDSTGLYLNIQNFYRERKYVDLLDSVVCMTQHATRRRGLKSPPVNVNMTDLAATE